MKLIVAALFAAVVGGGPALAMNSMSTSMMMPACKPDDPVVGVNLSTKTYMTRDQMKAKSAGMTAMQKEAMMKKHHVKMMCKSAADAMGAKMTKASM